MSELWQGILYGALLSIPFGIVANIASTPIGNWIAKRNQISADKRAASDKNFAAAATSYAGDRQGLYTYLLDTLIRQREARAQLTRSASGWEAARADAALVAARERGLIDE